MLRSGGRTRSAWGLLRFSWWARRQLKRGGYDASLSVTLAVPAMVLQPRGGTVRETLARNIARRKPGFSRWAKELSLAVNPKQLTLLLLEHRTLNSHRVRKIVAISRYVSEQLFSHYTIASKRVEVIPNAASVKAMPPEVRAEMRKRVRGALGLRESDVVFLFAAMNPGLKGLSPLLNAMHEVFIRRPEARLIVAGCLPQKLMRRTHRGVLKDVVRFVGPSREMDALYAASDVTVLPTYYDPASKVVIESLLHGIPAISTSFNGASQWITDPTGELADVPPGSEKQVAELMSRQAGRVIDSPDNAAALSAAMIALCDAEERAKCSAAAAGLDQRLSMDVHVDRLEKAMEEAGKGAGE